ncbi:MAG: glucosaminidase domain-containing protein [Alphaproteobacteria bacterium]
MSLWIDLIDAYKVADIEFPHLKPITLAQWAYHSDFGDSALAKEHLNFGGLLFREELRGLAEPVTFTAYGGQETYCHFNSLEDFIRGYWSFIDRAPYYGWRVVANDPFDFINYIGPIYNPQPYYVSRVTSLIDYTEDALGIYFEEEDRPSRSERPDVSPPLYDVVDSVTMTVKGTRPQNLEGLIVHYDAARIKSARALPPAEQDEWARRTLVYGGGQGLQYATMSRSGRIFLPRNYSWDEWGYHAGRSLCPVTGRSSVSRYYGGLEINNPGLVHPDNQYGVFCPWFNAIRDQNGAVILDGQGRCTVRSLNDEHYTRDQVRYSDGTANITPGWYVPFTREQMEALVQSIRFLMEVSPSFQLDLVLGHDEVSPGRKSDPGGAMDWDGRPITMPDFRRELRDMFGL